MLNCALQEFQHFLCLVAACPGMRDQWDTMRTGSANCFGEGFQCGFDDFNFTEHGRGEKIETRTVLNQEFGDVPPSHMGGSAETCLKVAAAPIPAGVDQGRAPVPVIP